MIQGLLIVSVQTHLLIEPTVFYSFQFFFFVFFCSPPFAVLLTITTSVSHHALAPAFPRRLTTWSLWRAIDRIIARENTGGCLVCVNEARTCWTATDKAVQTRADATCQSQQQGGGQLRRQTPECYLLSISTHITVKSSPLIRVQSHFLWFAGTFNHSYRESTPDAAQSDLSDSVAYKWWTSVSLFIWEQD